MNYTFIAVRTFALYMYLYTQWENEKENYNRMCIKTCAVSFTNTQYSEREKLILIYV